MTAHQDSRRVTPRVLSQPLISNPLGLEAIRCAVNQTLASITARASPPGWWPCPLLGDGEQRSARVCGPALFPPSLRLCSPLRLSGLRRNLARRLLRRRRQGAFLADTPDGRPSFWRVGTRQDLTVDQPQIDTLEELGSHQREPRDAPAMGVDPKRAASFGPYSGSQRAYDMGDISS